MSSYPAIPAMNIAEPGPVINPSFAGAFQAGLIEPATLHDGSPFVVGGVQYYQPSPDGANAFLERMHHFGDTVTRYKDLRVTTGHFNTVLFIYDLLLRRMNEEQADADRLQDLALQCSSLTERLKTQNDLGVSVEQVYELASTWYFSDQEDPGRINQEANHHKIVTWCRWKRADELYATFLVSAIGDYLAVSELSRVSVLTHLKEVGQAESLDLTTILCALGRSNDKLPVIKQRIQALSAYDTLLDRLLSRTTVI